jgi:hypothetical protein
MIKLSDYLNYLNKEIIQARKLADENAVIVAKEYAKHEYLKFFKVPRYSIPSIKMDIPLKITDIDSLGKYDFKFNETELLDELNTKIELTNKEKKVKIPLIKKEQLQNTEFKTLFKALETKDQRFVKNFSSEVKKIDLMPQIKSLNLNIFRPTEATTENESLELKKIFSDVLSSKFTLVSSQLKNIFIDPNTSHSSDLEKEKLFVNLHVEMEEEGIRIAQLRDKDGNMVEEITFE